MDREEKQEEINFAVSEWEDGVTGVTTLRGCNGLYWDVLGRNWAVMDSSRL